MSTLANTSDTVPPPRPIRFVHNQGQPPSKRRRINAACAGERPYCSTCTKNGHRCMGYPEEVKKEDNEKQVPSSKPDLERDEHEHHDYHADEGESDRKPIIHAHHTPDVPLRATTEATLPLAKIMVESKQDEHETSGLPPQHGHPAPPLTAHNLPLSPTAVRRSESHRVPYFRYFGPTAIVPGFKQMVVSVRDRRRSTAGSMTGTSPLSTHSGALGSSSAADSEVIGEDLPTYDPNDPTPVHPLITNLVNTFFLQMGSSYPFLRQGRFLRMVKEKRVEPILVDSICALASRFSDAPALTNGNEKMPRTERGAVFAQRARQATVDTFPCPTVGAVQACLLMAYEGFGASQDSALWMYLGLAIRMAVDLGLQKEVGVQYQGEKDPLYVRNWSRQPGDDESPAAKVEESSPPNPEEQKEVVQERMDTFWAVFILDRVISSGTGRPVTFRDDDLELSFPEPSIDPVTQWPAPYPIFLQIIHLYGRVCDVLNKIRNAQDLTKETWDKLGEMEHELTRLYKGWDWRLQFNVSNFKAYLGMGQGTTFILLHFWFHALFIILHQPTLLTPFAELRSELQLLQDSRELSMSSAKTICDILSFADLIDPKSFIGNPFTSQPIYIAACAFLMESSANASESPSRATSPGVRQPNASHSSSNKIRDAKSSRHSLLASAANQNYQKCYNSLQQVQMYWGGVTYILTALDQKAKGIWDCETYTTEEYESTKIPRRGSNVALNNPFPRFENQTSPKMSGPPIAWSLSGTANSPSSSLTLMYQNIDSAVAPGSHPHPVPKAPTTPPGNMVYDPIRQSLPDSTSMLAPAYPQPNLSAVRQTSRPPMPRRHSNLSAASGQSRPTVKFDRLPEESDGTDFYMAPRFTPTSQQSNGYDAYSVSPPTSMPENSAVNPATTLSAATSNNMANGAMYFGQSHFPYQMPWAASMGNMDAITFDSQDIDIGTLGLQQPELMGPWLEYLPGDVLGLFENTDMGHGGQ
ncbi:nitrogen assimilation transcription factor nit-4 [Fusarium albosuccineum]|uniref:Nitrogen assimilation transcription factor nit-4 n=1 Tax=Fusarium albosuccineum TaxID=1237068 RepID=A0A8H4LC55_9HYPO|nr:nitrogen assimilation transcription factor nit-4 [Fusarium albosuccineum]